MTDQKRFLGVSSGSDAARPTLQLGVTGGSVTMIALYGGGPYAVTDLSDEDFRERIDIYAQIHSRRKDVNGADGRDAAVRRLIEIGLEHCAESQYIESRLAEDIRLRSVVNSGGDVT